jgi:hypothetical protein
MERWEFLQGSAAGLGALVASRGLETLNAGPTETLGERAPAGSPSVKLVELPTTG